MNSKPFEIGISVTTTIFLFLLTISPGFTQTLVPSKQILNELDSKVRMPIKLPSQLPVKGEVYPNVSVGFSGIEENGPRYYDNQYFIDFDTSPNCNGTPDCSPVSFSATLNSNDFFFWVDTAVPTKIQMGDIVVEILDTKQIELANQWREQPIIGSLGMRLISKTNENRL